MKPWGPLDWLLGKLQLDPIIVIGCLGCEDRSVAVPLHLRDVGIDVVNMLRVDDGRTRFQERVEAKTARNRGALGRAGVQSDLTIGLMAGDAAIERAFRSLVKTDRCELAVVLDISCLPKRFFFLMLKLAMQDPRIRSLVVAYTQPERGRYTYEHLASDAEAVQPIPGYSPTGYDVEMLVVGLGFESLGLPLWIDDYKEKQRLEVLIPFPPGQPYSRRIWRTLEELDLVRRDKRVHRLNALDAFETYAKVSDLTGAKVQKTRAALAPYGPKPMSLGMCLYALKHNAPVLYTQPRTYHPDYAEGIGDSWGYCLKYGGRRSF